MRALGGAVAEDPLRLPVVGGEEAVDAGGGDGGRRRRGLRGEEGWVVQEGKGGVGDEGGRGQVVGLGVGHS